MFAHLGLIYILEQFWELAELPSVAALVAHDEGGHRFIGGTSLQLVVGAVALLALGALEEIGLGALHGGQLGIVDGLLDELLAQLLHLVAGHLLRRHFGQLLGSDGAAHKVAAQSRILGVLQIGHA